MQAVLGNAGFDPTKGSAGITADAMKTALANNGYTLSADGKNWGNGVASIATGVVSADGTIAAGKVGSATTTSTATHYAVEDQDAVALGLDQDAAKSTAGVVPTDAKTAFATDIGTSGYIGRDVAGDTVNTADEGNALTIKAADKGVDNQISGVTITVKNTKGQEQKAVNASLDNFSESIRAQNQSNDNAITLQTGTKANQSIRVGLTDMRAQALGLQATDGKTLQIGTYSQANAAINVLDNAVQKALDQQTTIGSIESRLEYTSSNLTTASENVQASESTIRDADMAKEMTEYTKNNVLLQAAQSMLAQANQNSSAVLSLLK
jgi:flagellin